MFWDHSKPFPPDPNAPQPRRKRQEALPESPFEGATIGPAAGAALRQLVYGRRKPNRVTGVAPA